MDQTAFQQWVETNSNRVFGVAFRITGHRQDAEEVVQETFLRAYKRLDQFRGDAAPETWLYRIATHCALDLLRRRKRRGDLDSSLEQVDFSENNHAPEAPQALRSEAIRKKLNVAMQDLTPMERAAFVLRHYEGRSCKAIAESLNCNVNRAKQAVFRAVRKLRKNLKPLVTP